MGRLPERNLDILRSVAVGCVVLDHAAGLWGDRFPRVPLGTIGHMGVALFFVHTSLVLMASLARLEQGGVPFQTVAARFYVRRAFRIYPLAIAAIIAVGLLQLPDHAGHLSNPPASVVPTAREWAANLALIQNQFRDMRLMISVLWTLPVELQMYLLLPLLYLVAKRGPTAVAVALAVAVPVAVVPTLDAIPGAWRLQALRFAPCFVSGVLAYAWCTEGSARRRWTARTGIVACIVLIAVFALVRPSYDFAPRWWAMAVPLALLLPRLPDVPESALTRVAASIARYSYGIYLLHVPLLVLWFVLAPGIPRWMGAMGFSASLAAGCWLSYRFIEAPGIALGIRLARRLGSPRGVAT